MLLVQIIIFQIIVFGAVIFALKKILSQDTESSINRLDKVYQDLLNKQKDLTQKIEAAEKDYNAKKEEGNLVVGKMKTEAMDEVRVKQDEVIKKAKTEAEEILKKAHESEEKFKKGLEKEFQRKVIEQAATILKVAFSTKIAETLHQALIVEFLERAQKMDLSQISANVDALILKSAFPLDKTQLEQFQKLIASKISRPVKLEAQEDKALIAGVLIQFGTLLLDGSLNNYVKEASEATKKNLEFEG